MSDDLGSRCSGATMSVAVFWIVCVAAMWAQAVNGVHDVWRLNAARYCLGQHWIQQKNLFLLISERYISPRFAAFCGFNAV